MILSGAVSMRDGDTFDIDMEAIEVLAEMFDDGDRSGPSIMGKLIFIAYQAGLEQGAEKIQEEQMQLAILLTQTGGNA